MLTQSMKNHRQLRRWREQYNPLRGLTVPLAVALLEAYPRGEMADLQWTYSFIEQSDPDLFALVERRASSLIELDWDIKRSDLQSDIPLGEEQSACLREAYDRIDNLYEAIEHLAMASFRGYAHLEKHRDADGAVRRLEVCDQWNVVRDGLRGRWKYNPEARPAPFRNLPDALLIEPEDWIMRETKRHIDRIGLIKFVRQSLSQKDWDGYIEMYGLPGAVVIGPPQVPPGKEASYEEAAAQLASGGSGYLPHGSSIHFSESRAGAAPFAEHLRHLTEQLVLAGTGGLLTMLTASGSGTLAGSVHRDAFDRIARMEARQIGEVFQKQFEAPLLRRFFPGHPQRAYFQLASNDRNDAGAIVEHAVKLRQSGYAMDAAQLSEKTGYRLSPANQQ
jgi:phage gp29-like protein